MNTSRRKCSPLSASLPPILAILLVFSSGCGGADRTAENPYRADYEHAAEQATSDFEREVLRDFEITRAEYEEAVDRYLQCASDRGVSVSKRPQGGYYVFTFSSGTVGAAQSTEAVLDECRVGTIDLIEPLYVDTLTNPDKEDWDELLVKCLVDKGLVTESYTVEQLRIDRGDGSDQSSPSYPFDTSDPRFDGCMANPSAR